MGFMATVRAIALMECMDQIYARQLRGAEVDADLHGTKAMAKAFKSTLSATGTTALVKQTGRSLSAALALKPAEEASDVIAHEVVPVRKLRAQSQFTKAAAKIEPTHLHQVLNVRMLKATKQFKKAAAKIELPHALEVISAEKIRELAASKERELQCDGTTPEGWGECSCQMPACTGGDDPDCATVFTSCMY